MFLKEELAVTNNDGHRNNKSKIQNKFRTKFKMNQHDPILTKEQPINSKIVSKSISKRKNKETVFRFKRKN